ncbi:thiamine phosphate synthase [Echinicola sp. CAU 1574]|uniref:Thiamine-phosphate synthase n=2 Tax=Echinicola arenosa TaxID=2774144 RepID=A0ABR9APK8_9BACT|nr:thiamine phosphate synthase [Echinicola arenosa]
MVTDQKACLGRDFFWVLEEAIKGGVDLVQIREKELFERDFITKAQRAKEICAKYNVPLIVNDSLSVAKAVNANGVHIGQSDSSMDIAKELLGENFPVGLSIEKLHQLESSGASKAWYYGVSPVFSTPTKTDTITEWGLEGIQSIKRITNKPLVAIGNIKIDNAKQVIEAGADCLAVVSAICSAESPEEAAASIRNEIEKAILT